MYIYTQTHTYICIHHRYDDVYVYYNFIIFNNNYNNNNFFAFGLQ